MKMSQLMPKIDLDKIIKQVLDEEPEELRGLEQLKFSQAVIRNICMKVHVKTNGKANPAEVLKKVCNYQEKSAEEAALDVIADEAHRLNLK